MDGLFTIAAAWKSSLATAVEAQVIGAAAQTNHCVIREERSFLEIVEGAFELPIVATTHECVSQVEQATPQVGLLSANLVMAWHTIKMLSVPDQWNARRLHQGFHGQSIAWTLKIKGTRMCEFVDQLNHPNRLLHFIFAKR